MTAIALFSTALVDLSTALALLRLASADLIAAFALRSENSRLFSTARADRVEACAERSEASAERCDAEAEDLDALAERQVGMIATTVAAEAKVAQSVFFL